MSSQRIRRDEFDIESRDRLDERRGGSRRSRSNRRSPHSRQRDDSRSRSRSLERNKRGGSGVVGSHRRGRYSNSRSHSRSRSRGYSRRRFDVGGPSRSRRHRDSRSRSYSRSRSRSPAYYRRNRNRDYDNDRDYNRTNSKSRSRSRSSSHFRDYSRRDEKSRKDAHKSLRAISEDDSQESKESYELRQDDNLADLPLPQPKEISKPLYRFDENEPIDRERIHREMEEKLRQTLAKEGKVYPPPKPEASHPVFANDGSFLEIFKKMQTQQQLQPKPSTSASAISRTVNPVVPVLAAAAVNPSTAPYLVATAMGKTAPPPPIVGRRKGGKILKTGVVAKPKVQTESSGDPKDFWSLYLAEVNKYKNTACESEQGNRSLVK